MPTETIYKDRDNINEIVLKKDCVAADLSSVTKMELIIPGLPVITSEATNYFDYTIGSGRVILNFQEIPFLIAGSLYVGVLYVYDPSNVDGINWGAIRLSIK